MFWTLEKNQSRASHLAQVAAPIVGGEDEVAQPARVAVMR